MWFLKQSQGCTSIHNVLLWSANKDKSQAAFCSLAFDCFTDTVFKLKGTALITLPILTFSG